MGKRDVISTVNNGVPPNTRLSPTIRLTPSQLSLDSATGTTSSLYLRKPPALRHGSDGDAARRCRPPRSLLHPPGLPGGVVLHRMAGASDLREGALSAGGGQIEKGRNRVFAGGLVAVRQAESASSPEIAAASNIQTDNQSEQTAGFHPQVSAATSSSAAASASAPGAAAFPLGPRLRETPGPSALWVASMDGTNVISSGKKFKWEKP